MRYFTYIAEQAFKTSDTGERLFYRSGFWSRPFVVPDADTERRLYRKHVWILRLFLGGQILCQPFLFMLHPGVLNEPHWFLIYLGMIVAAFTLVSRIVLAPDLRGLRRTQAPLRPSAFYGQMAQRHSPAKLLLGFITSLLFVAGGAWIWISKANYIVGVVTVVFFGLCTLAWSYAFYLKLWSKNQPAQTVLQTAPGGISRPSAQQ